MDEFDTDLVLDRLAVEEAGYHPDALAAAIHAQLRLQSGPTPVHAIARALDILEIREEPLTSFEGALLTTVERGQGSILVNSLSSRQRRRFTIGHELLHFLNPFHVPTEPGGFRCRDEDIRLGDWHPRPEHARHVRQEREANRFAIELLVPRQRLRRILSDAPDLQAVLWMSDEFDVSKEAAARCYSETHDATIAIALSRDNRLRYWSKGPGFPPTSLVCGMSMPYLPQAEARSGGLSRFEDSDAGDWLKHPRLAAVTLQTLYQQNGHAMTLVITTAEDNSSPDDEEESEEMYSRFTRLRR